MVPRHVPRRRRRADWSSKLRIEPACPDIFCRSSACTELLSARPRTWEPKRRQGSDVNRSHKSIDSHHGLRCIRYTKPSSSRKASRSPQSSPSDRQKICRRVYFAVLHTICTLCISSRDLTSSQSFSLSFVSVFHPKSLLLTSLSLSSLSSRLHTMHL